MWAALLPDDSVRQVLEALDDEAGLAWDEPWTLYGLRPARVAQWMHDELNAELPGSIAALLEVFPLVPAGDGHPAETLEGFLAPDEVFAVVLRFEGWCSQSPGSEDATEAVARDEMRICVAVLADGRVIERFHLREGAMEPPAVEQGSLVTGRVPLSLARTLGLALQLEVDPREALLSLLAQMAVQCVESGGGIEEIALQDPALMALLVLHQVRDEVLHGAQSEGSGQRALLLQTRHRAQLAGDWLSDEALGTLSRIGLVTQVLAGVGRAISGRDAEIDDWWGTEALVGEAIEATAPTAVSLAKLHELDVRAWERLDAVVTHRRTLWGIDDGATIRPAHGVVVLNTSSARE